MLPANRPYDKTKYTCLLAIKELVPEIATDALIGDLRWAGVVALPIVRGEARDGDLLVWAVDESPHIWVPKHIGLIVSAAENTLWHMTNEGTSFEVFWHPFWLLPIQAQIRRPRNPFVI